MSSLGNYFHTLRYLRPVQILGRIRFKLRVPRPDERPAPVLRALSCPYAAPIGASASMLAPYRFRFLNVEDSCAEAADWEGRGRPLLWTYNLHYFDDLNATDAPMRRSWHQRLVDRWIDENPPGRGIGWDPYPVSRRVVNWIKWSLGGNLLTAKARHSLAVQVRWLAGRVESHLQGNHVLANAKALVHAGLYFAGEEAERWRRRGLALMRAEIAEQVLADGGHFERSTMYHAGFVEDLLDTMGIAQAYGCAPDASWNETVSRMMVWLEAMSHPDMRIAFFNDAAFGVAPDLAQLRSYAQRLNVGLGPAAGAGIRRLAPSGYVSIDLPPFFLVCDVAPVGPDHLPAHAHADTLSFEMSFKGRRVFVNSGTSEYGAGAERQRQRGTAAHNTLVIDGQDSSEVWAGFRVARRARVRLLDARPENSGFIVVGEHDGYRRLRGGNIHRRSWTLTANGLSIEDVVEGPFRSAECYFHLHPEIHVQGGAESELRLHVGLGMLLEMRFEGAAGVGVVDSKWHPEFGVALIGRCIIARLEGRRLTTSIRRSGFKLRLLLLSFYFRPDLSAGSFRASTLADALLAILPAGSSVNVVTTAPNRYSTFTQNVAAVETAGALTIRRIALPAHRSDLLGQSRAFLHFARCANRYVADIPYDVVVATSSRLMTAALGAWIARRAHARLYLDIRDIFVDTVGDVFPKVASLLRPPLSALERWTMRRADRINLVSRGFESYFLSRYPDRSYAWFTNGIDEEFVNANWSKAKAVQSGPSLLAVYAGNIGEGQGLHAILPQLAPRLAKRVHFRVIGDGGRRDLLLKRLRRAGVRNVEVLPPMPRPDLLEAYAGADILFLHLNAHAAFEKVLPSKIFEYAATGKPIWAGVAGYAAAFIAAEVRNAAVFAPCDATQAIEKLDGLILQDQPRRDFMQQYARRNIARSMADDILKLAQADSP